MTILSLSGLIGSGKDTVADYLESEYGFTRMSFAGSLKDAVSVIFGWDRQMLEGRTSEAREEREKIDEWWSNRLHIKHLSPRWVLQYFGTEVCRVGFHQDIWLASLENKLRTKDDIVVTDTRFPNELQMLSNKGLLVHIKRGEYPEWWAQAQLASYSPKALEYMTDSGIHPSEWSWASYQFDEILDNNGSLDDLYKKVDKLV